jgi:hypothetical protein
LDLTTHTSPRSLSEFYIYFVIIFLNKLQIVENTTQKGKNQNKTFMTKALGSFRDSPAPSWVSGSQTDVPAEPPLSYALAVNIRLYEYGHELVKFRKNR